MSYVVLTRAYSRGAGNIKALRLRSDLIYRLDDARTQARLLESTEKVVAFIAKMMEGKVIDGEEPEGEQMEEAT